MTQKNLENGGQKKKKKMMSTHTQHEIPNNNSVCASFLKHKVTYNVLQ